MAEKTARVKMLGNYGVYEVGKEYDLPVDLANQLSGMGFAASVSPAPAPVAVKE
jgi:hypothetical protein